MSHNYFIEPLGFVIPSGPPATVKRRDEDRPKREPSRVHIRRVPAPLPMGEQKKRQPM